MIDPSPNFLDADRTAAQSTDGPSQESEPTGPRSVPEATPEISGYAIESILGRGGMGVVYKARQIAANRPVAIKMILGGELAGESERTRLRTEAESIARLNHPGIVQVYEVGEYRGVPFFSMEFCAGGSLAQHLGGNPLPAEESARLVRSLADALACAHDAGVIHRDLKPANILLAHIDSGGAHTDTRPQQSTRESTARSGSTARTKPESTSRAGGLHPKVTDFGLAKHLDAGPGQTRSGQVMGTPSYMAPEQALGETRHVGPAADVYSLGAILYECLTGRPPFKAATTLETLDQVRRREPVSIRALAPAVPRDLETICLKCLQKDSGKRYSGARELDEDLDRFLGGRPILARPVGPIERGVKLIRRNPGIAAAIGFAVFALVAGAAVSLWYAVIAENRRGEAVEKELLATQREGEANQATALALVREGEAKTALAAEQAAVIAREKALVEKNLALTREMRTSYARAITLASLEYERNNIAAVRRLLADCPKTLRGWEWHYLERACRASSWELAAHPPGRTRVRVSTDGKRLVSSGMKNHVKLWDANRRELLAELPGHNGQPFTLAAGGSVAVSGEFSGPAKPEGQVILWDLEKQAPAAKESGAGRWGAWVYSVATSPDGRRAAVGGSGGKVYVWGTGGDRIVRSWDVATGNIMATAFTADGEQVLAGTGKDVFLVDARSGVHRGILGGSAEDVQAVAASPNGRWAAVGYSSGLIRVYDLTTRLVIATLSGHAGLIDDLAFSPDGRHLASASGDSSARVWDVATASVLFHLRGHTGPVTSVAFTPDGRELVTAGADGTIRGWDLIFGNEPGSLLQGDLVTAIAGATNRSRVAWAFESRVGKTPTYHITVYDFDKNDAILNVPKQASRVLGLSFSPDARFLAIGYVNGNVAVFDLEGTGPGQTFKTGIFAVSSLAFSPDSRTLACAGSLPRGLLIDLAGKKLGAALAGHTGSVTTIAFRPGGTQVATGGFDGTVRIWNATDGKPLRVLTGHEGAVHSVVYRPDGTMLASCGVDGKIRLWNSETGDRLHTLEGHSGWVLQVLFTPDGTRLFSASSDRSLRCWDPDTGEALLRVAGVLGEQDRLAWIGGDRCLASGAGGHGLRLWQRQPLPLGDVMAADKLLLWHNQAWSTAMMQRNWFAMEHHLNWLIPRYGEKHPGLYDQRGRARLGMGRLTDGLQDFTAAIEKGYDDPRALMHVVDVHVLRRDWDQAEAFLAQFAKRRPNDPDGHYRRAVLAAFRSREADARKHQRMLREEVSDSDSLETRTLSLWLDAAFIDPTADVDARLAVAAKAARQNARHGFYRTVHALWLHRAGRFAESAAEASQVLELEGGESKLIATAVLALAARKQGQHAAARRIRDELEAHRRKLREARPEEWIAQGEADEWPTYLTFIMLIEEFDREAKDGPSKQ